MAMLNNQRVYIYIMIYTYAVAAQCALLMCSPRKPSVVMFGEDLPDRFLGSAGGRPAKMRRWAMCLGAFQDGEPIFNHG